LFKEKSGWTIKKFGDDSFILHFPSAELRDELTKFKGFEFATSYIKAKVGPIELEKVVVSVLEETWMTTTGFPKKAKNKSEVVKEIAHLVGDPIEVDEKFLKSEGKVRVKVLCKDATEVDGSTGHLLKWCSEKLEDLKKKQPQDSKNSRLTDRKKT
jgi:hypothetical protein